MSHEFLSDAHLLELLHESDDFAVQTVNAGQGGPFGSRLFGINRQTHEIQPITGHVANAVLSTGLSNAHAEDQNKTPELQRATFDFFRNNRWQDGWSLLEVSTGESCTSCQSKQEIMSRILRQHDLLDPTDPEAYSVVFGASYKDTEEVAGFNDAIYGEDMNKPEGERLIQIVRADLADLAHDVAKSFSLDIPTALLVQPNGLYDLGLDL